MISKISQTIRKYALLKNGETVLVAFSGGADSLALLIALRELAGIGGWKVIAAHFNHGQRGRESAGDEDFCRAWTQKLGLTFVADILTQKSVPRGMSPEDYFRQERYRFFKRAAADYQADKIALGHHRNDQAETVLLNFLRGSGADGLKGMLPMRQNLYIRPLLETSREEIIAFLKERGLTFREDSSNKSDVYLRNRLRHQLIPCLKEKYNPRLEESLARLAEIMRRDDEYLNEQVWKIFNSPFIEKTKSGIFFVAEDFIKLPEALGRRLLKALLEFLTPDEKGFSSAHIELLFGLAGQSQTGRKILALPCGLEARKEYGRMALYLKNYEKSRDYEYALSIPAQTAVGERDLIVSLRSAALAEVDFSRPDRIFLDGDKIKEPLTLRNRRPGDWFVPLGSKGRQKIKKLFIDRKIPRAKRQSLALLADKESVIWIENMHLSERVKISSETKNVLALEIRPG